MSSFRASFNFKKTGFAGLFALGTIFSSVGHADSCPKIDEAIVADKIEVIEFNKGHSDTLLSTLQILSRQHYEELALNDDMSEIWLDNFIEFLDPAKSYLFAGDIEEFEKKYSKNLDDLAKSGDLSPAKVIYERYRQRAIDRLNANLALINDEEYVFDYSSNDTLPIDRDEYKWQDSTEAADKLWEKQLTLSMLNLKLTSKPEDESREQIARRFTTQLSNLKSQKTREVVDFYLNALGHIYDPHTDYFSPQDSETFEITMSLSLEGIGAVLQREDEFTRVVSVVPGGPAQLQGELEASDRIVAIGEGEDCEFVDVIGWQLDDVVDRIRGPKDSIVRLKVIPSNVDELSEERKIVRIVRDRVKLEENAAKGEVIEIENHDNKYSLGVIDIPSFYLDFEAARRGDPDYRSTSRDVQKILDDFNVSGVDGIIIDLRQNGGGSLLEAAQLTDLFVDPGPVVQIKDQSNRIYRNHRARSRAYYNGPMIVLIDRLSASASEIFAGAIQDYSRGLIVGSQSFGKGTVQTLQPLPEGQLKFTESKFYRISGDSTQHKGVIPDISLPSLYNFEDIGESSYDNALEWDQIRGIPRRKYQDFSSYLPELEKMHSERLASNADMKFLLETISIAETRRSQKSISLNEEIRIEDRERWDTREDEILEAWRNAKGFKVVADDSQTAEIAGGIIKRDSTGVVDSISAEDIGKFPDANLAESLEEITSESDLDAEINEVDAAAGDIAANTADDTASSNETEEEESNRPDISEALLYESGRIFSDLLFLLGVETIDKGEDSQVARIDSEAS